MAESDGGAEPEVTDQPHLPARMLAPDEFGLTAADAESLKATAAAYRAAAADGGEPMWRAESYARAVALESIAEQVEGQHVGARQGNGGEIVVRTPIDAPWKQQELTHAARGSPALINTEASVARLKLARDADTLSLSVDTAERYEVKTPAEQMLAHQLATSHQLAMKLAAKSQSFLAREFLAYKNPLGVGSEAAREQVASIEAARLATASARMMEASARVATVLDRLQNGSTQTIVVYQQNVDVQPGAQAVVGGAMRLPPRRSKKKRKT